MQPIPWFSTFALGTEVLATVVVFAVFYFAYFKNRLFFPPVVAVLIYKAIAAISYVSYWILTRTKSSDQPDPLFYAAVVASHSALSLLVFVGLVALLVNAWPQYARGTNFFRDHTGLIALFLAGWLIALFSSFLFYYETYFRPEEPVTSRPPAYDALFDPL